MNRPRVSIITPSYNQGRFIRATIESVLKQDYTNIEYIIMDGGSTDETAAIAKEYSTRLTFISEPDRGQSHAINKGFRLARGEIVSWLNSDDILLPGAVAHAVHAFEQTPTLGAVYGEGYLIDYDGKIKSRFLATEPFDLWKLIYVSDYILQQTVYFRRAVFEEVGFINEDLHWGMDWEILMRIGKRYWIEYIPQYMGCLREYAEAKTFSGGHKRFRELATIMRSHGRMRYPPGYFSYGLHTYQEIICRHVPISLLRHLISRAAFRYYSNKVFHGQGIYRDGSAGQHAKYMFPAGRGRIRIFGTVPNVEALMEQTVEIICNGSLVERRKLPFGEFEFQFDWNEDDGEPIFIEMKATKVFVPSIFGNKADTRKISFALRGIEWSDGVEPTRAAVIGPDWTPPSA